MDSFREAAYQYALYKSMGGSEPTPKAGIMEGGSAKRSKSKSVMEVIAEHTSPTEAVIIKEGIKQYLNKNFQPSGLSLDYMPLSELVAKYGTEGLRYYNNKIREDDKFNTITKSRFAKFALDGIGDVMKKYGLTEKNIPYSISTPDEILRLATAHFYNKRQQEFASKLNRSLGTKMFPKIPTDSYIDFYLAKEGKRKGKKILKEAKEKAKKYEQAPKKITLQMLKDLAATTETEFSKRLDIEKELGEAMAEIGRAEEEGRINAAEAQAMREAVEEEERQRVGALVEEEQAFREAMEEEGMEGTKVLGHSMEEEERARRMEELMELEDLQRRIARSTTAVRAPEYEPEYETEDDPEVLEQRERLARRELAREERMTANIPAVITEILERRALAWPDETPAQRANRLMAKYAKQFKAIKEAREADQPRPYPRNLDFEIDAIDGFPSEDEWEMLSTDEQDMWISRLKNVTNEMVSAAKELTSRHYEQEGEGFYGRRNMSGASLTIALIKDEFNKNGFSPRYIYPGYAKSSRDMLRQHIGSALRKSSKKRSSSRKSSAGSYKKRSSSRKSSAGSYKKRSSSRKSSAGVARAGRSYKKSSTSSKAGKLSWKELVRRHGVKGAKKIYDRRKGSAKKSSTASAGVARAGKRPSKRKSSTKMSAGSARLSWKELVRRHGVKGAKRIYDKRKPSAKKSSTASAGVARAGKRSSKKKSSKKKMTGYI